MVTLITSLYRSEKYLSSFLQQAAECLSRINTAGTSAESLIIANDATPEEKNMLKSVSDNPFFRVLFVPREPLYATWNRGVSEAKGDLIGPWNVDDMRFPEAVIEAERLVLAGADVIYFPFIIKRYISVAGVSFPVMRKKIQGEVLNFERRKFETGMICGPHFMFTKNAFEKVGYFDEQFKIAGDFDWCTRAAALGLNFRLAQSFSGVFRVDGNGLSAGATNRKLQENSLVYLRRGVGNKIEHEQIIRSVGLRSEVLLHGGEWQPVRI